MHIILMHIIFKITFHVLYELTRVIFIMDFTKLAAIENVKVTASIQDYYVDCVVGIWQ